MNFKLSRGRLIQLVKCLPAAQKDTKVIRVVSLLGESGQHDLLTCNILCVCAD